MLLLARTPFDLYSYWLILIACASTAYGSIAAEIDYGLIKVQYHDNSFMPCSLIGSLLLLYGLIPFYSDAHHIE